MNEDTISSAEQENDVFQHSEWDWDDATCPVCDSEYTVHRVSENRVRRIVGDGDVVEDRLRSDREEVIIKITCRDCNELLYDKNHKS